MTGSSSMGVSRSEDKRVALSERIRQRHSCVLQFEELLRQFFRYVDFLIATGRLQTELSNDLFFRVVLPAQGDDLGITRADFAQVFHQLRKECFENRFFLNVHAGICNVETDSVAVIVFVGILEGCELDEVLTALEARKVLCTSGTALAAVLLAAEDRKAFVIPSENASAGTELRMFIKIVVDAGVVDQIINNGYIKLPLFLLRKSRPIDISNDKQQAHDLLLQNTYRFSGQVLLSISPVFPAASVLSFC